MRPLIEIEDLEVRRGEQPALKLDRLEIRQGEVLALIGPNGAGKSTLLLTLARLLKPERGRLCFRGRRLELEPEIAYRRRLALVLQEPLLLNTSAYGNVACGLRYRGLAPDEIRARVPLWLERLGVGHLAARRADQLSGGEAQRVSLARALVLEPELLLLDEPFSSLDPPTREDILEDLEPLLKDTVTTTVFVTHDLRDGERLADRMAVFIGNRLRQVGSVEELLRSPADEEVARFLTRRAPSERF